MVHSSLTHPFLATCALAWTVAACSGNILNSPQNAGGLEAGYPNDAGLDAGYPNDAGMDAGRTNDAGLDAGRTDDANPPATPQCNAGDRNEWSGLIPNTTLAVAVCSTCGESYVVASNSGSSPGEVSVNNGSTTITANVPAGGSAMTAMLADNAADGTVSVCGTTTSRVCLPMAPQNQQYCNPYRAITNLVPQRIDQGVDYGGAGPIYAIGPGTIDVYLNRNDSGWPGGTFASYQLSAGPASGKVVYLAENIDLNPALHSGSFVFNGTVLGTLVNASPYSESGWGVQGASYTAEHSCYVEGCTTALGINFNQLLVCLRAPSGVMNQTGCCPSAAGWPTDWCTLLAGWQ